MHKDFLHTEIFKINKRFIVHKREYVQDVQIVVAKMLHSDERHFRQAENPENLCEI